MSVTDRAMRIRLVAVAAAFAWMSGAVLPAAYADAAATGSTTVSTAAPTSASDNPEAMEEVTVEAHRQKLGRLRQQINKAVDDFFDAFNKVNTVAGYETTCSDEKPTGSYIRHHICTPRFVQLATEEETQGFFDGYAAIPASNLVALRMPGYKKQLQALIHSDPRVRQAAADFDALGQRYAAVSREKVKAN